MTSMKTITAKELNERLDNVVLLDVRTPAEFGEIHIAGSALHPLHALDAEKALGMAGPEKPICVICRSGARAKQAAEKLAASANGTEILVLEGGVTAWDAAGHPVNRGQTAMSIERQVRIAAGSMILLGAVLGFTVNAGFFGLCAFVGAGLVFAGITDWCGMGMLLARMPWNNNAPSTCCVKS